MHLQADHLSELSEHIETSPMDDKLIDEDLFVITTQPGNSSYPNNCWKIIEPITSKC